MSLSSFLKKVTAFTTSLEAKTSGLFSEIDGAISLLDSFSALGKLYTANSASSITTTALTYDEKVELDTAQTLAATLVNPIEVPLTANLATPVATITDPTAVTDISPTQPGAVYTTPVGTEPPLAFRGVYPYVHTYKSMSGHIKEVDDTPGHERLFDYHKSGTYQEIAEDGRRVVKVIGDNFQIVVQDDNIYIEGSQNIYVKGNMSITCLNDVSLNVGGRVEMNVNEDFRLKAKSISLETTSGDINVYSANNLYTRSVANTSMYAGKNIGQAAGANVSINSGSSLTMASTVKSTFKSSAVVAIDAPVIASNIKQSANVAASNTVAIAKKTGLGTAPTRESTTAPSIVESIIQGLDDDAESASNAINEAVAAGRITQEEADALKTAPSAAGPADTSPFKKVSPLGSTNGIENLPEVSISDKLPLSKNYKLSHLTAPGPVFDYPIRAQAGKTKAQLAANLALLAQNVLEPIRKKYGNIQINSAFRHGSGKSQHDRGQAVDITYGIKSTDPATMLEIAKWIRDNVAFDQLIHEYGNSQIWTHVSFDGSIKEQRGDVRTCPNPSAATYPAGLQLLNWKPH